MNRDALLWFGLGLIAALAATPALLAGGFPWLLLFAAGVGLTCAVHGGSRRLVLESGLRLLSRGVLKTLLIVFGALMLIQLLPLEIALLMAGDVLAYVEVVAAVGLIAANTRLRVIRTVVTEKLGGWIMVLRLRPGRRAARSVRSRAPRRPPAADDDPAGAWALA
ncbi:hypothetical protein [Brevundimonas sp.]|jgi:hypothetical protein|uniref:hypothetical protein n=1 Tax=Brevundimonas sp. TaxID=1871086 RepID=UPI0037C0ADB5